MINNFLGISIGQNNLEVTPAHINEVNDEIRVIVV